jgi:hypothetical protein
MLVRLEWFVIKAGVVQTLQQQQVKGCLAAAITRQQRLLWRLTVPEGTSAMAATASVRLPWKAMKVILTQSPVVPCLQGTSRGPAAAAAASSVATA